MPGILMWFLIALALGFSLWYNYYHFKNLLSGHISLEEVVIAGGSILLVLVLLGVKFWVDVL